jgi:hypothetical protein
MNNIVSTRGVVLTNSTTPSKPLSYPVHDLNSVFTHYDKILGKNVPTENIINGGVSNGKSSK